MPNKALAGNGARCGHCGGAALVQRQAQGWPPCWPCPGCDGTGRVAIPAEETLAAHLAENLTLRNPGGRD